MIEVSLRNKKVIAKVSFERYVECIVREEYKTSVKVSWFDGWEDDIVRIIPKENILEILPEK